MKHISRYFCAGAGCCSGKTGHNLGAKTPQRQKQSSGNNSAEKTRAKRDAFMRDIHELDVEYRHFLAQSILGAFRVAEAPSEAEDWRRQTATVPGNKVNQRFGAMLDEADLAMEENADDEEQGRQYSLNLIGKIEKKTNHGNVEVKC